MNPVDREKCNQALVDFEAKRIPEKEALRIMIESGTHPADAQEMIFISKGGDDVVMLDEASKKKGREPLFPEGSLHQNLSLEEAREQFRQNNRSGILERGQDL